MPKGTAFHGILAVGRSKTDAVNQYRLLAMGKGAVAQVSGDRDLAFITQASHAEQMFNPYTGNMDLESDSTMLEKFEFASNSSANVEVNHLVCESGCGVHVVFDSENLVKYCPQCTSALASDDDASEDGEGDEDEGDESEVEDLGDAESDSEACESSDDDEEDEDEDEDEDENEDDEEESDDDSTVVVSSSFDEALAVFASNKDMASLSADEQLRVQYVVCSSDACKVHILSDKVMSECPVCQSSVEEPAEAPEGIVDLNKDESNSEDLGDGEDAAGDSLDDEDESEDEGSEDEGSDEGESDDTADDYAEEGESESSDEEGEDDGNSLSVIDDKSSTEEGDGDKSDDELSEDSEEIAADSDMDESASADQLDVSYSSSVGGAAAWTAYHNGVPVAMARKAKAGKNADIFDSPSFGHAVLASAKVVGVKKALGELGFDTIKHKVSVSKEVRRMVESQVAEQREALASELKGYQERFGAALATAAIGINRGFFADVQNPIKAALWNAMSSAGIRNPEVIIDNAFRTHGDAYHKMLFAQANDIVAKPLEVQESLSKAILGTNYQAVSSEQPGTSVEDRLAGMGTSVSTEQKPGAGAAVSTFAEVDPVGMQKIHRAVSSLGRRGR